MMPMYHSGKFSPVHISNTCSWKPLRYSFRRSDEKHKFRLLNDCFTQVQTFPHILLAVSYSRFLVSQFSTHCTVF